MNGSNISIPWPLLRPEPPTVGKRSPEIDRRIRMYGAVVASGTTLERLTFMRLLVGRRIVTDEGR